MSMGLGRLADGSNNAYLVSGFYFLTDINSTFKMQDSEFKLFVLEPEDGIADSVSGTGGGNFSGKRGEYGGTLFSYIVETPNRTSYTTAVLTSVVEAIV